MDDTATRSTAAAGRHLAMTLKLANTGNKPFIAYSCGDDLARRLGWRTADMLAGRSPDDLFGPSEGTADRLIRAWEGEASVFETKLACTRCVVVLTPVRDGRGVFEVIVTVTAEAEDSTLRGAERIIREGLFDLLETSDIGLFYAENGEPVFANGALLALYGCTADELGRCGEIQEIIRIIGRREAGAPAVLEQRRKDGTVLHVECRGMRTMRAGREALYAVVRDTTEQVRTAEHLLQSEERYRGLVMYSPVPIVLHSSGELLYANEAAMKLIGAASSKDFLGKSVYDYLVDDAACDSLKERIERLAGGSMTTFSAFRLRRPDGAQLEVELSSTPVADYFGKPLIQTVLVDVTERRRMEEWLRKTEKLAVLGELAAGIAHEVRNPLTSLKGFIQLLRAKSPEYCRYYAVMLEEIERINQIAGEFMFLAKPHMTRFEPHDVTELLEVIATLLQAEASLAGVGIVLDLPGGLPKVRCDGIQMKQVFVNIIKNAIEAMKSGGQLTVSAALSEEGRIAVTIADTGIGMTEERLARIGEPFYTTKEKGTGLGMMICYRIIEAHQGSIRISSKPGQGTVVQIVLPVAASD